MLKALKGRDKGDYHVVETLIGSDLVGWKYRGPFDELPAQQGIVHTVIPWNEVSATEGTGIVHIAPGCGREDYALSKEFNLPVVAPVDEFGVYMEGYDWMISKKRYYGLALPIYDCPQCGTFEVIGSKQELKERATSGWEEFEGHSPHRPWVDAVTILCKNCGSEVSRIKDVGNPWLDAGIVPYSTLHYRTNREYWEQWFPADFVTESFPGQFKNWFYSMLVMSTVLENQTPFKTLFGYALLMGEDGTPMHKSKGNLVVFDDAAERVGSDTMRWLFADHTPEQNLSFPRIPTDEDMEKSAQTGLPVRLSEKWMLVRRVLDKLWNVYGFFVTYANIDTFDPMKFQLSVAQRSELDRWILSELQQTIQVVTHGLEQYDTSKPAEAMQEFLENLSNWYLRRSRE